MSNHKYRIYNKDFSEYVYRTLKALPAFLKNDMAPEDQKVFRNDTVLSDYCSKEQMDRLLLMLTKVGKQWDIRIYDEGHDPDELEFNTVNQYQFPQKRIEVAEALARDKMFYMTANDVMMSAMMSEQNIHSPIYRLSVQSRQLSPKVSGIKSLKIPFDEQSERSIAAYQDMNKMLLQMLNAMTWARNTLSLEQGRIRVLAALFEDRHGALTMAEIAHKTAMVDKPAFLHSNVSGLLKERMIISDKSHGPKVQITKGAKHNKKVYYMIAAAGIKAIMEFNNYIHKKTFG